MSAFHKVVYRDSKRSQKVLGIDPTVEEFRISQPSEFESSISTPSLTANSIQTEEFDISALAIAGGVIITSQEAQVELVGGTSASPAVADLEIPVGARILAVAMRVLQSVLTDEEGDTPDHTWNADFIDGNTEVISDETQPDFNTAVTVLVADADGDVSTEPADVAFYPHAEGAEFLEGIVVIKVTYLEPVAIPEFDEEVLPEE